MSDTKKTCPKCGRRLNRVERMYGYTPHLYVIDRCLACDFETVVYPRGP